MLSVKENIVSTKDLKQSDKNGIHKLCHARGVIRDLRDRGRGAKSSNYGTLHKENLYKNSP